MSPRLLSAPKAAGAAQRTTTTPPFRSSGLCCATAGATKKIAMRSQRDWNPWNPRGSRWTALLCTPLSPCMGAASGRDHGDAAAAWRCTSTGWFRIIWRRGSYVMRGPASSTRCRPFGRLLGPRIRAILPYMTTGPLRHHRKSVHLIGFRAAYLCGVASRLAGECFQPDAPLQITLWLYLFARPVEQQQRPGLAAPRRLMAKSLSLYWRSLIAAIFAEKTLYGLSINHPRAH